MGDCLLWQLSAVSQCILLYYYVIYFLSYRRTGFVALASFGDSIVYSQTVKKWFLTVTYWWIKTATSGVEILLLSSDVYRYLSPAGWVTSSTVEVRPVAGCHTSTVPAILISRTSSPSTPRRWVGRWKLLPPPLSAEVLFSPPFVCLFVCLFVWKHDH